jgi:predicted Zn-dependent protease
MEARTTLSRLIEQTKRQGARACEALYEQSSELGMTWERGSTGLPTQRQALSVRLGVYLPEGREAWCDVKGADAAALLANAEPATQRALQKAKGMVPDPHAGPVDRYDISERGLGLLDRRQANLGLEDRRSVLEDNAAGCRQAHPDLRVERLSYRELLTERGYASSRGHSATEVSSRFVAELRARMGRSGRPHVLRVASRQFANVASMPFGVELGRRMVRLAESATLPAGELPLVLDATASAHLLRSMAPAFIAPDVHAGRSFLARCFGQRLAAPKLHVIDDPALPGALESRAFDDRGVPPVPVVLLREGIASGLYLDPRSARQANLRPTGHVMDGSLRPSNLVARPGNRSRNAIGMDLNDYLVIDNFHADQPVDLATGQLRSLCDVLVYRDHTYVGAVQGVPIDMPLAQFLGAIVEIASDQARYAEADACSMVFEGISLSA